MLKFIHQSIVRTAFATATIISLTAPFASADGVMTRHRVEVGGGMESALDGDVHMLIKVGYGLSQTPGDLEGDLYEGEQLVWAHVTGDFGVDTQKEGWDALPYMNINIIPVHNSLSVNLPDGKMYGDLRALPMQIKRDIALSQEAYVRISIIEAKFGRAWNVNDSGTINVFAQAVADVLGYKYVDYANKDHLNALRILGANVEGGVAFVPSNGFRIQWVIGGGFDLNAGSDEHSAVMQSDLEAYTAIRMDLTRFINVFLKLSQSASCLGNADCDFTPRLMAGASIQF